MGRRPAVLFASPSLAFVLTLILTGGPSTPALPRPAPPTGLTFPREEHGACPFECCWYGGWVARRGLTARRDRTAEAPAAFRIAGGEAVQALTGVVVTTRPGRARALAPLGLGGVTLAPGDEVPVLRYAGEGVWIVWAGGRPLGVEGEAAGGRLRVLVTPRAVWWVQIRNRRGEVGWSDQPDLFDGRDRCGS